MIDLLFWRQLRITFLGLLPWRHTPCWRCINRKAAASLQERNSVKEFLVRFVIGGFVVSSFAVLGDMLKPKSFAGLFSAAPSVALASLGLAVAQHGTLYARAEAKSMVLGAIAFVLYAWAVSRILFRTKLPVLAATAASLTLWLASALGLWAGLLR